MSKSTEMCYLHMSCTLTQLSCLQTVCRQFGKLGQMGAGGTCRQCSRAMTVAMWK